MSRGEAETPQQSAPVPQENAQFLGTVQAGDHHVNVWQRENGLLVSIDKENHSVAMLLLPTSGTVFDASALRLEKETPLATPEHPPITLEGYVGRTPAYRDSKHPEHKGEKELFFPVSYRPDLNNRDYVLWYDVYTYGEKANELNEANYPPKGKAVRVTGADSTHTKKVKTKEGPVVDKIVYEIQADDVTVIKTRPRPMS